MNPIDRLIVALDVDSEERAVNLIEKLQDDVMFFKVGFELFSSCGPDIVKAVTKRGCKIFLDLKFHDIPNTVSKAAVAVTRLGVSLFNVHALGGFDMMKKTADAVREEAERLDIMRPKILAVTILTSMDENALKNVGIRATIEDEVLALATLASQAGLDGVVASAVEARRLRQALGEDFLIVTPGVRPAGSIAGDQKRIATPKEALENGASHIVVGRPITEADDPVEATRKILEEISRN